MSEKKLHPSVQQFKDFVKRHPKMILEVRRGKGNWQDFYEEWYLLGEDDSRWTEFNDEKNKSNENVEQKKEWVPQIMGVIKNMDPDQLQSHIANMGQALGAIQGILGQFQNGNTTNVAKGTEPKPSHPFHFRKD